jgi:hypothetical protein
LFGARHVEDQDDAAATRERAMKALATLLRYRGRIEREIDRALRALDALRARPGSACPGGAARRAEAARHGPSTREPDRQPAEAAEPTVAARPVPPRPAAGTSEPEPPRAPLNRPERRRLAVLERQAQRRAA